MKLLPAFLVLMVITTAAQGVDPHPLRAEAASIVKRFGGQLRPALQDAMRTGGPQAAIEVCAEKAPAIAQSLSEGTGWEVRRISLKPRNVSALPDEWAASVLRDLDARAAAGEGVSTLFHEAEVDGEYRFVRAQAVEPVCLACHGETIAPSIKWQLDRFYPDDNATGYRLGELRGAFYLSK